MYFRKNPVQEPRKIARNREFSRKITKFARQKSQRHLDNASKPCQNMDQIHQNRRKSSKSYKSFETPSGRLERHGREAPQPDPQVLQALSEMLRRLEKDMTTENKRIRAMMKIMEDQRLMDEMERRNRNAAEAATNRQALASSRE